MVNCFVYVTKLNSWWWKHGGSRGAALATIITAMKCRFMTGMTL